MPLSRRLLHLTTACLIAPWATACLVLNAAAQSQEMSYPNQTSMTIYQVIKDKNGEQCVLTPRGFELPLPAPGIAKKATQLAVFRDPQNNFWYTDVNGAPVKITAMQLQWQIGQRYGEQAAAMAAASLPQPAGMPPVGMVQQPVQQPPIAPIQQQPPGNQTTNIYQGSQQSGGSGSSALATGLAAGAGGMVGGMMGGMIGGAIDGNNYNNHYYGMPYGVPMYRGVDSHPYYYGSSGSKVYVNNNPQTVNATKNWAADQNYQDKWHNYSASHPTAQAKTWDGAGARQAESRFAGDASRFEGMGRRFRR